MTQFTEKLKLSEKEFSKIKKKREKSLKKYLNSLSHTLLEWEEILGEEKYYFALRKYHNKMMAYQHGTDYYAWNDEYVQDHNYNVFKKELQAKSGEEKFHYNFQIWNNYFFKAYELEDIGSWPQMRSTDRYYDIVLDGDMLNYNLTVVDYNGFKNVSSSDYQNIRVNTSTNEIEYHSTSIKNNGNFHG